MINRIPCKCLLISSLSGLTRKRGMARASLAIPTRFLVAPDKLDIKIHKLGILYVYSLNLPSYALYSLSLPSCRYAAVASIYSALYSLNLPT